MQRMFFYVLSDVYSYYSVTKVVVLSIDTRIIGFLIKTSKSTVTLQCPIKLALGHDAYALFGVKLRIETLLTPPTLDLIYIAPEC